MRQDCVYLVHLRSTFKSDENIFFGEALKRINNFEHSKEQIAACFWVFFRLRFEIYLFIPLSSSVCSVVLCYVPCIPLRLYDTSCRRYRLLVYTRRLQPIINLNIYLKFVELCCSCLFFFCSKTTQNKNRSPGSIWALLFSLYRFNLNKYYSVVRIHTVCIYKVYNV